MEKREATFEETMTKNFLELIKSINQSFQEVQCVPSRINKIKQLETLLNGKNTKGKEILTAAREKSISSMRELQFDR